LNLRSRQREVNNNNPKSQKIVCPPPVFPYFCDMNKYIEYIEHLLYLHDCVILPGFGGFICNYKEASVDPQTGLWSPPMKTVIFNKHLQENDGLLIHWIAQAENISYEKAQQHVTLFREEVKVLLNQKRHINFGHIGTFSIDKRSNLLFESSHQNFLVDALGMETIQISLPKGKIIREAEDRQPSENLLNRLFKYGLSSAVITGIIIISQQDIFKGPSIIKTANLQPAQQKNEVKSTQQTPIVSPDCDFVHFDPASTLNTNNQPD